MSRFLLDTNIISDLVRNPSGPIASRIAEVGESAVYTSIIVAAELRFGAAKKGSSRLTSQLERILSTFDIQAFEAPADEAYANLRTQLEAAGTPIGGNDMLIAAQALTASTVLVTNNEREFTRVQGLLVENWLK